MITLAPGRENMRLPRAWLFAAAMLACVPDDDLDDDAFRAGPTLCMQSLSECSVDYFNGPCAAHERNACADPYHSACISIAAELCEVIDAGAVCPPGWFDGCEL